MRHATPARLRQRHFPDFYRINHLPIFRALAATLGDADLAREAADEAMTRAFQRWDSVSTYSNAPDDEESWTEVRDILGPQSVDETRRAGSGYLGHRVGIAEDGTWQFFVAGD